MHFVAPQEEDTVENVKAPAAGGSVGPAAAHRLRRDHVHLDQLGRLLKLNHSLSGGMPIIIKNKEIKK